MCHCSHFFKYLLIIILHHGSQEAKTPSLDYQSGQEVGFSGSCRCTSYKNNPPNNLAPADATALTLFAAAAGNNASSRSAAPDDCNSFGNVASLVVQDDRKKTAIQYSRQKIAQLSVTSSDIASASYNLPPKLDSTYNPSRSDATLGEDSEDNAATVIYAAARTAWLAEIEYERMMYKLALGDEKNAKKKKKPRPYFKPNGPQPTVHLVATNHDSVSVHSDMNPSSGTSSKDPPGKRRHRLFYQIFWFFQIENQIKSSFGYTYLACCPQGFTKDSCFCHF